MAEPASLDVKKIARYMADHLREPVLSKQLMGKIKEAILSLADMPTRHALVADERLSHLGVRMLMVERYVVFYMVSEQDELVNVIRVLYGRRDWMNLL